MCTVVAEPQDKSTHCTPSAVEAWRAVVTDDSLHSGLSVVAGYGACKACGCSGYVPKGGGYCKCGHNF